MRIESTVFNDIRCSPQFIKEYDSAPTVVRRAVDKLIRLILDSGQLPNSMKVHKAEANSDVWIGYVTRTKQHWRVLFFAEENALSFVRLIDHDEMNKELKATFL